MPVFDAEQSWLHSAKHVHRHLESNLIASTISAVCESNLRRHYTLAYPDKILQLYTINFIILSISINVINLSI